jgi:hypothetical protein
MDRDDPEQAAERHARAAVMAIFAVILPARHVGGFCSIERDTDPARLSPDNVTMVIAALCIDNQVERVGNADLAFHLEICAFARHFAD